MIESRLVNSFRGTTRDKSGLESFCVLAQPVAQPPRCVIKSSPSELRQTISFWTDLLFAETPKIQPEGKTVALLGNSLEVRVFHRGHPPSRAFQSIKELVLVEVVELLHENKFPPSRVMRRR